MTFFVRWIILAPSFHSSGAMKKARIVRAFSYLILSMADWQN